MNCLEMDGKLFFKWIEGGICASPDAAWAPIQVAGKSVRTAMGEHAWGLIGHDIRWVNDLSLQANLLIHMLAILYFQGFPGNFSHIKTPLTLHRIEYTLNFKPGKE